MEAEVAGRNRVTDVRSDNESSRSTKVSPIASGSCTAVPDARPDRIA